MKTTDGVSFCRTCQGRAKELTAGDFSDRRREEEKWHAPSRRILPNPNSGAQQDDEAAEWTGKR